MTREEWLNKAVVLLKHGLFKEAGADVPQVRVSVGFPGGGSARKRIGEYWKGSASKDGVPNIFISPVLDTPFKAIDTLVHELVHAVHPDAGHRGEFKTLALKLGLEGKMTHARAGEALKVKLEKLIEEIGEFPHSGINLSDRKKQKTALMKLECKRCGYLARVTNKWIDSSGTLICPCNMEPMEVAIG